jgi:hypothetical protein
MFESKTRQGRVMMLCAATAGADSVRKRAIERSMRRLAERLETEVGTTSISPVLWDYRSRFILVAELPYQPDDKFALTASRVFSLSELGELRTLAAVDCDLLLPVANMAAGELASTIPPGRQQVGESNDRQSTLE